MSTPCRSRSPDCPYSKQTSTPRGDKPMLGAVRSPILVFGLFVVAATTSAHAAPANGRSTLQGSLPTWATSKNYQGAADTATSVGFRVYLGWTDPAGAEALAKAVSDPQSSSYGKYLSPNQFRARFAPTASDTAKVQNWLKSQGFDVQYTPRNNHYISAEGTLAQAQAAFGSDFGSFKVQGQSVRAPLAELSVPSAIAGTVKAIVGLDQSDQFVQTFHRVDKNAPPSGGFRNAAPLSAFWAQLPSPYAFPTGFT